MKNTLIFLLTEGIGLNSKWKGNYLKLAEKPNMNYLISGIYPWALISNSEKNNKTTLKKKYGAVKKDIDANFYEMLYGTKEIKTYLDLIQEDIDNQRLQDLQVFSDLEERAKKSGSKNVHIFSMLSNNKNKFNANNLYFIINVILKKGLRPVVHLIADGQEERPYSFNKTIIKFMKFLNKRHTPVATIAGRNNALIRYGHNYLENQHAFNYFETLCGTGESSFQSPLEYTNENLANKIMDADIKPAFNGLMKDVFLNKKDSVLFLNSDPDDFSVIASMIKTEPKLEGIYIASLGKIYGTEVDSLFYEDPTSKFQERLITSVMSKHHQNALVLSLNHKKGFVNKFFGENNKPNIERKAISTSFCMTNKDYYFSAPKLLIDKAIQSIGKYDVIFIHAPMIAEAARTSNLNDLIFAIESFDKNLGRLINFCNSTGNIIAFTSAYGASEKMLDKHLNIVPYNKNSMVPFVFTNGDLASKKIISNFISIYASTLSTLDILDNDHKLQYYSLINKNFSKDVIGNRLNDAYDVWKTDVAQPLIEYFEDTRMNFYSEYEKDEKFLDEKKQYVVLKELLKLHENVLLSSEARKKLFNIMLEYVKYNKIDFIGKNLNIKKTLETLFDSDINLQKLSKVSNKYFDRRILNTNFKRNEKWVSKTKFDLIKIINRSAKIVKKEKVFKKAYNNYVPYLFFEKVQLSEMEVLKSNDAVSVIKFYDLIRDELTSTYEQYVAHRINEDDDEKDLEQLAEEQKLYSLSSYYGYFLEVLDIIDENRELATKFNKKYLENIKGLQEKNVSYEELDLLKKPDLALNPLVLKIVKAYKLYLNDIKTTYKNSFNEIKKRSNKYDNNYSLKYNIAQKSKTYEGEFLEGIDLSKQNDYKDQFNKHFELYKEFDVVSLDSETNNDDHISFEEKQEFDEFGNPIVVDNIERNIRLRPEYDLTNAWIEKRKEEYMNIDKVKTNVAKEAEDEILIKKKFIAARKNVQHYNNLSEMWNKQAQKN